MKTGFFEIVRLISCAASLFVVACVMLTAQVATAADQPEKSSFVVTSSAVGPDAPGDEKELAKQFVESLAARPGVSARLEPRQGGPDAWNSAPANRANATWVSFVTVAAGERRDFLALVFDEKGTSVIGAAHRPAKSSQRGRRDWYGPGLNQIPENAVKELAADVAHLVTKSRDDRRIKVESIPWTTIAKDAAVGLDSALKDKPADASALEAGRAPMVDAVRVLAIAALVKSGYQPTLGDAGAALRVEVGQAVDHLVLRITLTRGEEKSKCHRLHVSQQVAFENLTVACRRLLVWRGAVRDAAWLGDGPAEPLLASTGLVVGQVGLTLSALDPLTAETKWTLEPALKSQPQFFVWRENPLSVYRGLAKLDRVDSSSGKTTVVADAVRAFPWSIDIAPDGRVCVGGEALVSVHRDGKEAWRVKLDTPLAAGPVMAGDRVLCATESGEMLALAIADGREIFRKSSVFRLHGPMTLAKDRVIAGSLDGKVRAIAIADGAAAWEHEAKDILLERPRLIDGHLLIADKGNTVWLIDAATGAAKASFGSTTWLRGVLPIEAAGKKFIVVADLRGGVTFLSVPDLKPVRTVELGAKLNHAIAFAPEMFLSWGAHDELEKKAPTVIVGDAEGWLYLLDVP